MPTLLLIRHGRTSANTTGVLAGWTPGVTLDDTGVVQARALAERLGEVPFASVVASPLQRTVETAKFLLAGGVEGIARPKLIRDKRLGEVKYGEWENRKLSTLAKEPLWRTVQGYPSQVTFPGGESLRAMQARAVEAIREHDRRVAEESGEDAIWVAVSHGDVIKSIIADAMGTHLDHFQRISVDPASVSIITYTALRPFVVRMNDSGAALTSVLARPPRKPGRRRRAAVVDAAVGGGAGPSDPEK
ncbi:MAG TPA: MSMEG_4193 family putative phosphomutase [Actinopolymorphaceae bacterium]|jgi:probable phosphomutase (TIGR03848 family)